MSALPPVPAVPIRDDAQQDSIWKRWFTQLQVNQGNLGGFAAGSVIFADAGGNPTSDTAFTFNATTNVLTVNGSTFGTNTQVGGTLGVTGNTTLTGDLSVQGNTTLGNAATDTVTSTAGMVVTGAGAGTARSDTGIEIQRATNSGISLYSTDTGGITNESFVWFGAKDDGGNISKQASISSKWAVATSGTAVGVLRLNATYQTAGPVTNDNVALRIFGNNGISMFGSSDVTGPGQNELSVNGNVGIGTETINLGGWTKAITISGTTAGNLVALELQGNRTGAGQNIGGLEWYNSTTNKCAIRGSTSVDATDGILTFYVTASGGVIASRATLSSTMLSLVGDLEVKGGDITTTVTTFNLIDTTATTLNIGRAATTLQLGAATGVLGFCSTPLNYQKYRFGGGVWTSGGASTSATGIGMDPYIVGANGDISYLSGLNVEPQSITTQGNSETIGTVATVRLSEPNITVGTGDTITTAATLYISGAPTEGSTNAAIYVNSGSTYFQATNIASTLTLTGTAANIALGSNFISNGGTDAGLSFDASNNATFSAKVIFSSTARLKNYTVATLPAGTQGDTAFVTDALAPTFLTALTGGGAIVTPAFYNGTNWVAF